MKFTFTLSREDVAVVNKVVYSRFASAANAGRSRLVLLIINIATWMTVGYGVMSYLSLYKKYSWLAPYLNEVLLSLGVAVALFVASSLYQQKLFRNASLSEKSWLRAPQCVIAAPGGLEVETSSASSRYEWSRFTDCSEDRTMLYLFQDLSLAVVIPKNAFSTPEELQQLRSWAKSSNRTMEPTR